MKVLFVCVGGKKKSFEKIFVMFAISFCDKKKSTLTFFLFIFVFVEVNSRELSVVSAMF